MGPKERNEYWKCVSRPVKSLLRSEGFVPTQLIILMQCTMAPHDIGELLNEAITTTTTCTNSCECFFRAVHSVLYCWQKLNEDPTKKGNKIMKGRKDVYLLIFCI